jgi:hypothetical protein
MIFHQFVLIHKPEFQTPFHSKTDQILHLNIWAMDYRFGPVSNSQASTTNQGLPGILKSWKKIHRPLWKGYETSLAQESIAPLPHPSYRRSKTSLAVFSTSPQSTESFLSDSHIHLLGLAIARRSLHVHSIFLEQKYRDWLLESIPSGWLKSNSGEKFLKTQNYSCKSFVYTLLFFTDQEIQIMHLIWTIHSAPLKQLTKIQFSTHSAPDLSSSSSTSQLIHLNKLCNPADLPHSSWQPRSSSSPRSLHHKSE